MNISWNDYSGNFRSRLQSTETIRTKKTPKGKWREIEAKQEELRLKRELKDY